MATTHDSFFRIGSTHAVCQDYAATAQEAAAPEFGEHERTVAVVGDGCSGEADTDVGSRLVVHGFLSQWRQVRAPLSFEAWVERMSVAVSTGVSMARAALTWVSLPPSAATVTAVVAEHHGALGNRTRGAIFGDGALTFRFPRSSLVVVEVVPPSSERGSLPAYPSYDPRNIPGYLAAVGGKPSVVRITFVNELGQVTHVQEATTDTVVYADTDAGWSLRIQPGMVVEHPWPRPTVAVEAMGFDLVTCLSDGSGTGKWDPDERWSSLVQTPPDTGLAFDLAQVKQPHGHFLRRRADNACRLWTHSDDLSGAALHVDVEA